MTDTEQSPNIPVGYYQESQWTAPRVDCPHPEYWHSYDIQATEVEVIDMVWGMVRALQPDVLLETGTSRGFLASAIAQALKKNGHGHLHTYEPVPFTVAEALVNTAEVKEWLTIYTKPSMQKWEHGPIDFAWFDSLLDLRWKEFDFYYPHMHDNTVVGFHDTAVKFGPWSEAVRVEDRIEQFDLPTPHGVILGRVR